MPAAAEMIAVAIDFNCWHLYYTKIDLKIYRQDLL